MFRWTAPSYNATATLYAAGNSSNGMLDLLGDGIDTDTLEVTVRNGTGAPPSEPPPVDTEIRLTQFASGLSARLRLPMLVMSAYSS